VSYTLQDIDLVRERMGVGYAQARDALELSEGDVIGALAIVEQEQLTETDAGSLEELIGTLAEEVKSALTEDSGITRVDVKLGDTKVKELPVALAGVGAVLVTILSALLAWLSLELVKRDEDAGSEPRTGNETGQA